MNRLLIAATAGATTLCAVAAAQDARTAERTLDDRSTAANHFVTVETLLDANITNPTDNDHEADIDDIVVDARSGRAILVIVDTNELMGSENRRVAIPYGALSWQPSDEDFVAHITPMQLRSLPEWKSDDLASLRDGSWRSTLRGIFGDQPEFEEDQDRAQHDEYTRLFSAGRPKTITGQVVSVEREATSALGSPYVAVTVSENESDEQCVVLLAPAAWLEQKQGLPNEGDMVTITAVQGHDAEGETVHVAQRMRADDDTLELRDRSGAPAWSSDTLGKGAYHVLASTLNDGDLRTEGRDWGDVTDVVFEASSGTAAFALISVGGVLGIDDTMYAVPFDVLTVDNERNLHIDMPIEKLKLAPKLSEDGIKDLEQGSFIQRVCTYYGTQPMRFQTDRAATWQQNAGGSKP